MKLLVLSSFIFVASFIQDKAWRGVNANSCHSLWANASSFLAMLTPYKPETAEDFVNPAGCKARQIWLLSRHGARYPKKHYIRGIVDTLPAVRDNIINAAGKLCNPEIERLRAWTTKLRANQAELLANQGYVELEGISRRLQARFPELFPRNFSTSAYNFRYTVKQRTEESAKAFTGAIFGPDALPRVHFPKPQKKDPLLLFHKHCNKYKHEVKENSDKAEFTIFKNTPQFTMLASRVNELLNLSGDQALSIPDILLVYKTCGFETAWDPAAALSPWCALFTEEDLRTLEYQQDLESYFEDGYAYPITYEHACMPIVDVARRFSARARDSQDHLLTTAYFTHSGALLKVYGRLGLFKDPSHLTSDSYADYKYNRQWRNGRIGKFASNLVFVLFECPAEAQKYQIGTFVQEKPTPLPACGGQWLCPLVTFTSNLKNVIDTCDVKKICKIKSKKG